MGALNVTMISFLTGHRLWHAQSNKRRFYSGVLNEKCGNTEREGVEVPATDL